MKNASIALLVTFLALGCGTRTRELEQQVSVLQGQNKELTQDNASQDAYIDQVVSSINEIYREIEMTRSKEQRLLSETKGFEGDVKLTRTDVRAQLIDRISAIHGTLRANSEKLNDLQKSLNASRGRYAGLQKMVTNLKETISEREQSIALLETRVRGLETEVAAKTTLVASKDSVIGEKEREIATVYYVIGTKDELERKGIIRDEGGLLSIGETTVLASGIDKSLFTPVDKNDKRIFHVEGKIDDILPKRSEQFYKAEQVGGTESLLTVADLERFWQDKYLVILVD